MGQGHLFLARLDGDIPPQLRTWPLLEVLIDLLLPFRARGAILRGHFVDVRVCLGGQRGAVIVDFDYGLIPVRRQIQGDYCD